MLRISRRWGIYITQVGPGSSPHSCSPMEFEIAEKCNYSFAQFLEVKELNIYTPKKDPFIANSRVYPIKY